MTAPIGAPDQQVGQAAVDPMASQVAQRVDALRVNHPWMDPQTTVSLAASNTSDSQLADIASSFKSAVQSAWDGFQFITHDPVVLQKQPTAALALRQYLTSAIGDWPIADGDMLHVQSQLQAQGVGKGLAVDGTWGPEWQAAYKQAADAHVQSQLAGAKPGSMTAGHAAHGFLSSILPTGSLDAVIGFVKSIPGDVRTLAADIGGGAYGAAQDILHPEIMGTEKDVAARSRGQAAIENALGNNVSPQEIEHRQLQRAVNDVGTLFMFSGVGAAKDAVVNAAGENFAKKAFVRDLTSVEAQRGPGIIARTLFGGLDRQAAQAAAGVSSEYIARRGLMNMPVWQNVPVLRAVGPAVGKLADADGYYYRARTWLATPYQMPAVRAGGAAVGNLGLLGAGARGVANLAGPGNATYQGVQGTHTLDAVNDRLKQLTGIQVAGHRFSLSLDDLAYVLHGPINGGPGAASETVGKTVQALNDSTSKTLGDVGATAALERATGTSYKDLLAATGNDPAWFNKYLSNKVRQAAAYHYAEVASKAQGSDFPQGLAGVQELQRLAHEAWSDPNILNQHAALMLADKDAFTSFLKREYTHNLLSPQDAVRQDLQTFKGAGADLSSILNDPAQRQLLITPLTREQMHLDNEIPLHSGQNVPAATVNYLRATNPEIPIGSVGVARNGIMTQQKNEKIADGFTQRLADAPNDPTVSDQVSKEAAQHLFVHFGQDARKLQALSTPEQLVGAIKQNGTLLPREVYIPEDAPAALKAKVQRIADAGYQIVSGTDVGHLYEDKMPPLDDLGRPLTRARKLLGHLGLNPERFTNMAVGEAARVNIRQNIQKLVDDGKIRLPAYYTPDTLIRDLQDDALIPPTLGKWQRAAFGFQANRHIPMADRIAADKGITRDEALGQMQTEIARALQLRDIPRKQAVAALTRTDNVPWVNKVDEPTAGLMSKPDANLVYDAIRRGYSQRGTYMMGLPHVEDVFRSSMGFAGRALPNSDVAASIGNLPNRLVSIRDQYRFQLSPYFSARRIAKTNVKLGVEGVPPTLNPSKRMLDTGTYDDAHALLDRIYPKAANDLSDSMDKMLQQEDVWGLYNPRQYEAYAAHEWARQGLSDDQIKQKIVKVFDYGSSTQAGRTALERSANFVFFPFSFEKTLYRNLGGYLLDHPAQLMVMDRALQAYKQYGADDPNGPLSGPWLDKHLPILKEAQNLNAFAHGVSFGEPGGINAPVLNMFMPQAWATTPAAHKTLLRFIPAVKDASRILTELTQQAPIAAQAIQNGYRDAHDYMNHQGFYSPDPAVRARAHMLDPNPAAETTFAQLQDAGKMKRSLETAWKATLDYNSHQATDADKYTFPAQPWMPPELQGKPINKTTIGLLVHRYYPAYDPVKSANYARTQAAAVDQWVAQHSTQVDGQQVKQFVDVARQVMTHQFKDEYDTPQLHQLQDALRQAAIALSEQDGSFRQMYSKNFEWALGPIESVTPR